MPRIFWILLITLIIVISAPIIERYIGADSTEHVIKWALIVGAAITLVLMLSDAKKGWVSAPGSGVATWRHKHPFLFWLFLVHSVALLLVFLYLVF